MLMSENVNNDVSKHSPTAPKVLGVLRKTHNSGLSIMMSFQEYISCQIYEVIMRCVGFLGIPPLIMITGCES